MQPTTHGHAADRRPDAQHTSRLAAGSRPTALVVIGFDRLTQDEALSRIIHSLAILGEAARQREKLKSTYPPPAQPLCEGRPRLPWITSKENQHTIET